MPKYDFKCNNCSEVFELSMSIKELEDKEADKKVCPKCNSREVKQLLSFASVGSSGSSSASSSRGSSSSGCG